MSNKNSVQLLDHIADRIGTEMLSDLRTLHLAGEVLSAISQLEADSFPLEEWKKAANYMMETSHEYASSRDARQELLIYFQNR